MDPELELEKKFLKAQRLKTMKSLELEYSKEIVQIFRDKQEHKKNEELFLKVIELYKSKIDEIDFLKRKKDELLDSAKRNQLHKEENTKMLEAYLKDVERKRIEFDIFMKEKGKEALNYFKRKEELKAKLDEELHRFQKKKRTKALAVDEAQNVVTNYREKKEKERIENEIGDNPHTNIIKKIHQTFHNMGNKIDYSTTRFHNITLLQHNDQSYQMKLIDEISANEKAKKETEKLLIRKKSEEAIKKTFENKTEKNSKEILRKERANRNLKRLEEELNKLNEERKKSKNKSHIIIYDNNIKTSKRLEKNAEIQFEKMIQKNLKNRKKIFVSSDTELKLKCDNMANHAASIEEINQFYQNIEQEKSEEEYLNQAIIDHNKLIEEKNKIETDRVYEYEEPILRSPDYREEISRLNPVDIKTFTNAVKTDYRIQHAENKLKKQTAASLLSNFTASGKSLLEKSNSQFRNFNIKDLLQSKKEISYDDETNNKADLLVQEFLNDYQKSYDQMQKNKSPSFHSSVEEYQNNMHHPNLDNFILKKESNNLETHEKEPSTNFKNLDKIETKKTTENTYDKKQEELISDNKVEDPKSEFFRDKTKWKLSQEELKERRRKMLKDKSLFKK
jgi:hypothetical protein